MIRIIIEIDGEGNAKTTVNPPLKMTQEPEQPLKIGDWDMTQKPVKEKRPYKFHGDNPKHHGAIKGQKAKTGIKKCQKCGKEYKPTSNAQHFCGECRTVKPNSTHACKKCGKPFKPLGNRQIYCSLECGMKPKTDKEKLNKKIEAGNELMKSVDEMIKEIPKVEAIKKAVQQIYDEDNKSPRSITEIPSSLKPEQLDTHKPYGHD